MDRPILLDSRGGIITPATPYPGSHYAPSIQEWLPDIAPFVDSVSIPVVSVDATAIFDGRPDDLVRVTYTSGAALTFFVDSIAGGDDSSGKGTADDPWRSLNTASAFLTCASCVLTAACQYIQVKVKGTVNYVSGSWDPFGNNKGKLILTGWDGVCDLGSGGTYYAGYIRDCAAQSPFYSATVHSGGTVYSAGPSATAINAAIPAGGTVALNTAVDCSGGGIYVSYASGGSFASASVGQAVSIGVSRYIPSYVDQLSAWGLLVGSSGATYRASVFVSADDAHAANAVGIAGRGALIDCTATVIARASGYDSKGDCNAVAQAVRSAMVVSGGTFTAIARGAAIRDAFASTYVYAGGIVFLNGGVVHGAVTDLSAVAHAEITDMTASSAYCIEDETTANMGTSCTVFSARYYSSGVMYSSYTSSRGVC